MNNVISIKNRHEFREWLILNHKKEDECFVVVKRGRPLDDETFYYLDAVEEALCFGWIDSKQIKVGDVIYQRFSPRKKNSPWSELNKERARRLIKLKLMDRSGKKVLPDLSKRSFQMDEEIIRILKENRCYSKFKSFPPLYQRVRIYNIVFYRNLDNNMYQRSLEHFIDMTKNGQMYGEWNDYGRLIDY